MEGEKKGDDDDDDDDVVFLDSEELSNNVSTRKKNLKEFFSPAVKKKTKKLLDKALTLRRKKLTFPINIDDENDFTDFKKGVVSKTSCLNTKPTTSKRTKKAKRENVESDQVSVIESRPISKSITECQQKESSSNQDEPSTSGSAKKNCHICFVEIPVGFMQQHLSICMKSNFQHQKKVAEKSTPDEKITCPICGKDLQIYGLTSRTEHINKCLDQHGTGNDANIDEEEYKRLLEKARDSTMGCPMCGKKFQKADTRLRHLKQCAQANNLSVEQLRALIGQQAEEYHNQLAAGVLPQDFRPPLKQAKVKVNGTRKPSKFTEDVQLAKALSKSQQSDLVDKLVNQKSSANPDGGKKSKQGKSPSLLLSLSKAQANERISNQVATHVFSKSPEEELSKTPSFKKNTKVHVPISESLWNKASFEMLDETASLKSSQISSTSLLPQNSVSSSSSLLPFYVDSLLPVVSISTIEPGSKLKRCSEIPGRDKSFGSVDVVPTVTCDENNEILTSEALPVSQTLSRDLSSLLSTQDVDQSQTVDILAQLAIEHEMTTDATQNSNIEEDYKNKCPTFSNQHNDTKVVLNAFAEIDSLSSAFISLVDNPMFSDIAIKVKEDQTIVAHQNILSVRCPALYHTHVFQDGKRIIYLLDFEKASVIHILHYIYGGRITNMAAENLEDVRILAKKFDLKFVIEALNQRVPTIDNNGPLNVGHIKRSNSLLLEGTVEDMKVETNDNTLEIEFESCNEPRPSNECDIDIVVDNVPQAILTQCADEIRISNDIVGAEVSNENLIEVGITDTNGKIIGDDEVSCISNNDKSFAASLENLNEQIKELEKDCGGKESTPQFTEVSSINITNGNNDLHDVPLDCITQKELETVNDGNESVGHEIEVDTSTTVMKSSFEKENGNDDISFVDTSVINEMVEVDGCNDDNIHTSIGAMLIDKVKPTSETNSDAQLSIDNININQVSKDITPNITAKKTKKNKYVSRKEFKESLNNVGSDVTDLDFERITVKIEQLSRKDGQLDLNDSVFIPSVLDNAEAFDPEELEITSAQLCPKRSKKRTRTLTKNSSTPNKKKKKDSEFFNVDHSSLNASGITSQPEILNNNSDRSSLNASGITSRPEILNNNSDHSSVNASGITSRPEILNNNSDRSLNASGITFRPEILNNNSDRSSLNASDITSRPEILNNNSDRSSLNASGITSRLELLEDKTDHMVLNPKNGKICNKPEISIQSLNVCNNSILSSTRSKDCDEYHEVVEADKINTSIASLHSDDDLFASDDEYPQLQQSNQLVKKTLTQITESIYIAKKTPEDQSDINVTMSVTVSDSGLKDCERPPSNKQNLNTNLFLTDSPMGVFNDQMILHLPQKVTKAINVTLPSPYSSSSNFTNLSKRPANNSSLLSSAAPSSNISNLSDDPFSPPMNATTKGLQVNHTTLSITKTHQINSSPMLSNLNKSVSNITSCASKDVRFSSTENPPVWMYDPLSPSPKPISTSCNREVKTNATTVAREKLPGKEPCVSIHQTKDWLTPQTLVTLSTSNTNRPSRLISTANAPYQQDVATAHRSSPILKSTPPTVCSPKVLLSLRERLGIADPFGPKAKVSQNTNKVNSIAQQKPCQKDRPHDKSSVVTQKHIINTKRLKAGQSLQLKEIPVKASTSQLTDKNTPTAKKDYKQKRVIKESMPSPFTPMAPYDDMNTPELKNAVSKIGVRPMGKKGMRHLLKHVYKETHQYETDSDVETTPIKHKREQIPHSPTTKLSKKVLFNKDSNFESGSSCSVSEFGKKGTAMVSKTRRHQDGINGECEDSASSLSDRLENHGEEDDLIGSQDSSYSDGPDLPEESILQLWPEEEEMENVGTQLTQTSAEALTEKLMNFIKDNQSIYEKILMYEALELDVLKKQISEAGIRIGIARLQDFLDERNITFSMKNMSNRNYKQQSQRGRKKVIGKSPRKTKPSGSGIQNKT